MFLGYQNELIDGSEVETLFVAYVAETREELENMPCASFAKIEETDKTYFLHNGEYVCEVPFDQQLEEMRQARADAYASEVDPITAHINRLRDEEATTNELEAEIRALIEERKTRVAEIKARYPYPSEPIEEIEDLEE